ncbi:N-acetyltransferase, partial [Klebsiella pneumoniae]|nr:N-acetyltransferase [Klebsiella pneumoniae]
ETLAGFATYRMAQGHIVILHSEVFPEFEHRGLAGRLAGATLDDIRRRGLQVVPRCPYFQKYVREHPEYDDLVIDAAL